jgi:hypothetical protein
VRRDFQMPEHDTEYLDSLGIAWDTIQEGPIQWLVLRQWPIADGYHQAAADVALKVEANYPDTQIDMAYFCPFLTPTSGCTIRQIEHKETIEGRQWQRWSRHRTAANPWRPGVDCVATHMAQVKDWLVRATNGGPR